MRYNAWKYTRVFYFYKAMPDTNSIGYCYLKIKYFSVIGKQLCFLRCSCGADVKKQLQRISCWAYICLNNRQMIRRVYCQLVFAPAAIHQNRGCRYQITNLLRNGSTGIQIWIVPVG